MNFRSLLFSVLVGFILPISSNVSLADEAKIRKLITTKFPEVQLEEINEVKGINLYEIVIEGDVIYVDSNLRYFIDGNLIDLSTMQNITRARKSALEAEALSKLAMPLADFPLELAFTKVHGDGSRKMAYFADPNCGYCKRFEKNTLPKLKNVTIYIFPYPIISDQSVPLTHAIWCSGDREKAWDNYVLKGKAPMQSTDCSHPIDNILAFGKRMRIRGTPTLFFSDGSRVPGMMGIDDLEKKLNQSP